MCITTITPALTVAPPFPLKNPHPPSHQNHSANPHRRRVDPPILRFSDRRRRPDDAVSAPDLAAYAALLRSCIRSRDLPRGRRLHRRLLESNLRPDSVVANSLITLYSKSGDWAAAFSLFRSLGPTRDIVSWTSIISGLAQADMKPAAISTFCEMLHSGLSPNEYTFSSVLQACSDPDHASIGRTVFGFSIKMGSLGCGASIGSALIDMFAKNHDLVSARKVFDRMLERNVVVWTLLITRYTQYGYARDAIELFLEMGLDGFEPDRFTFCSAISACTELESFRLGQQLHSQVIRAGLASDVCIGCSLIDMYAKCSLGGSMGDSRKVFDQMTDHNVMSWTAVISGYVQNGGKDGEAIELFGTMIRGRIRPNHFTYSSVLKACASSDPRLGQQVHARVIKLGFASVNFVGNSLISMYSRVGRLEEAQKSFNILFEKNLISYNAITDGYVRNSTPEEAFGIPHRIKSADIGSSAFTFASLLSAAASIGTMGKGQQLHGQLLKSGFESDRCVCNALVSMYSRCGSIEDAIRAFQEMGDRNVISWTSMITGLAKHGLAHRALESFREMLIEGVKPNEVTYTAVLSACSHMGLVREGREHFDSMRRDHRIVPRMEHYACMVDLLGRSGNLQEAIGLINSMPCEADALVWRTLLAACRIQRNIELGRIAANRVLELEPHDPAAYVLLSNLYAAVGLRDEAAELRKSMREKGLIKEAGLSWVEIGSEIHRFHVGDASHPRAREIFEKLDEVAAEIKGMGYVPDTEAVLHEVEDELKERYLFQHSERIAVAFGLISTSAPRPIRVFKNLRVCGDCHVAIKLISKATGREVVLRDSNRFHLIKDGDCSCGEYW